MKVRLRKTVNNKRWKIAQAAEREFMITNMITHQVSMIIETRKKRFSRYIKFIRSSKVNFKLSNKSRILDIGRKEYGMIDSIKEGEKYSIDPLVDPTLPIFRSKDKIKHIKGIGEFLPFKDASFDIIISTNTLDHTQAPPLVLTEIKRVLKKKGFLILSVYTCTFIKKIYILIKEKIGIRDLPHPFSFTRTEVEKLLKKTGFWILDYKQFPLEMKDSLKYLIYKHFLYYIDKLIDKETQSASQDVLFLCRKEQS